MNQNFQEQGLDTEFFKAPWRDPAAEQGLEMAARDGLPWTLPQP